MSSTNLAPPPAMDATMVMSDWLERFDRALASGDAKAAASMFGTDCFWRDLVAFTWNIKTMEGRAEIETMLDATLPTTKPCEWRLEGEA